MSKTKTYTGVGTVLIAGLLLSGCTMSFTTSKGSETGGTKDKGGNTQTESPGKNVNDSAAVVDTVNSYYKAIYSMDMEKVNSSMTPDLEEFAKANTLDTESADGLGSIDDATGKELINIYKKHLKFNEFVNTPEKATGEAITSYMMFNAVSLMGASMTDGAKASYTFTEDAVTVDGDTAVVDMNKGNLVVDGQDMPATEGDNKLTLVKENGNWLIDYASNAKSFQSQMM